MHTAPGDRQRKVRFTNDYYFFYFCVYKLVIFFYFIFIKFSLTLSGKYYQSLVQVNPSCGLMSW